MYMSSDRCKGTQTWGTVNKERYCLASFAFLKSLHITASKQSGKGRYLQ